MKYRRSLATTQRFGNILSSFVRYGFEDVLGSDQLQKARQFFRSQEDERPSSDQLSTPERVRLLLQELGPTFVKFGQMIASQSTSLPPEWTDELSKLQNNVPPFTFGEVSTIFIEEFGAAPDEIFAEFSPEPLAAASIGQVHQAVLTSGEKVAVKIQRPNILSQIEEDLTIMHNLAQMLESTLQQAREMDAVTAVDEFATSLLEELSYRNEGRNAERLSKNLAHFPNIRAPRIYWESSTDRILTMEFMEGVKVSDVKALDAAGVEREKVATDFVRSVGQQILIDGFFHADPHPGNISVNLETKELIFLDLGMMGILDKEQRREFINLMLAVYNRDSTALTRVALELGTPMREVDRRKITREIERLLGKLLDVPLVEVGAASFFADLIRMLQDNGIKLPSELVMALKSLMQMMEVVVALNPQLSFREVSQTIANLLLKNQMSPSAFRDFLQDRALRLQQTGPLVDNAIEEILRQLRSGSITVEMKGLDLSQEMGVLTNIARQFTMGVALAGSTIGSAIAMSVSPQENWAFIPVLGVVGFSVSIVLIAYLVWRELRGLWSGQ
ncbi:AarF/ABC1/UbiB kinase family protein [Chloroflexi bacterium TSY]|nr:AarF/ABC1/UbiB kinase family protein [Chloroflexi bacterium TSY]